MEEEERPRKQRKRSYSSEQNVKAPTSNPEGDTLALGSDNGLQERLERSEKGMAASTIDETSDEDHSSGCRLPSESLDSSDERDSTLPKGPIPISKNQLKKFRRREQWEAGRADRRVKRKQKIQEQRARKRAAKAQARANGTPEGRTEASGKEGEKTAVRRHVRLPISFVIDCGFDNLMVEKERISLGSQLTRCYSDNHRAPFQAHLLISSWGGRLKERFDTVLNQHYESWKGTTFVEDDFVLAAQRAKELMTGETGSKLEGAFESYASSHDQEAQGVLEENGDIVYLTADSPNTLDTLKPYSVYLVGGLVDKNRHKGICYKTARDRGIKTAKLPIGQYMEMQSRFVLATNHVVEIMVRWLECGDWAEAFMQVMPKRKGGKLREPRPESGEGEEQPQMGAGGNQEDETAQRVDKAEPDDGDDAGA